MIPYPSPADLAIIDKWFDDRLKTIERKLKITPPERPETPSEEIRRMMEEARK